jgi:hypothetical protein
MRSMVVGFTRNVVGSWPIAPSALPVRMSPHHRPLDGPPPLPGEVEGGGGGVHAQRVRRIRPEPSALPVRMSPHHPISDLPNLGRGTMRSMVVGFTRNVVGSWPIAPSALPVRMSPHHRPLDGPPPLPGEVEGGGRGVHVQRVRRIRPEPSACRCGCHPTTQSQTSPIWGGGPCGAWWWGSRATRPQDSTRAFCVAGADVTPPPSFGRSPSPSRGGL